MELCGAPVFEAASRVWQRTQAIVKLPLDRSAEECLPNSERSSPRRRPAGRIWQMPPQASLYSLSGAFDG
jgi:hypothetical protein